MNHRPVLRLWRKGRDSNPRGLLTLRDFQSRALGQTMRPFQTVTFSRLPAERVGFEPTRATNPTAFRERHLKPLGHLSAGNCSSLNAKMQGRNYPAFRHKYARQDSNLRPSGPQPDALSAELRAHIELAGTLAPNTRYVTISRSVLQRGVFRFRMS
jgi:hypothetical protein